MDSKEKQIRSLKKLIRGLKAENEYLKSPLYLLEITEAIQGRYSVILNPTSQDFFTTTLKQKACSFKIKVNEIVCIKADGKLKWIYFIKEQRSFSGELYESEKLSFTGTVDDFCEKYDAPGVHLCIVSRSAAINPYYYVLNSKKAQLVGSVNPHGECNDIPVSPKHVHDFIEIKTTLEAITSFQKIQFRSK